MILSPANALQLVKAKILLFGKELMYALVKGKSVSLDRNFKDSKTQRKRGIRWKYRNCSFQAVKSLLRIFKKPSSKV